MLDNQKYSILLPARIVEYFPETQTATVQICAETIYSNSEEVSQLVLRRPLEDVPVHTVGGGGWHLTMPIKPQDSCIVSFSQVGYDHWFVNDLDEAGTLASLPMPHLHRQFNENDGFVTVGFNTLPRAIAEYSPIDSEWRNADATQAIRLKEDLSIVIDSTVSVTINAPEVIVNCERADVNASEAVTVDSPDVDVTCETADVVASSSVTLDTPNTTITGNLDVQGNTTATNISATGTVEATIDVKGGPLGTSLATHIHTGNLGAPTTPPLP